MDLAEPDGLSGSFHFKWRLSAGRSLVDVFCKTRNRYAGVRFVLNAVDSRQDVRFPGGKADLRSESGDRVETNGGRQLPFMRECYFDTIRQAGERNIQTRVIPAEMF